MMNKIESPEESRKLLDKIFKDLTRSIVKKDELTRFWFFILLMFIGVGLWGWIIQSDRGLGVTGMRDYVSWGIYIANFVFFVAVSLIGFLLSSVMHLLKIDWAKPVSRVAEQIAIAAVALGFLAMNFRWRFPHLKPLHQDRENLKNTNPICRCWNVFLTSSA